MRDRLGELKALHAEKYASVVVTLAARVKEVTVTVPDGTDTNNFMKEFFQEVDKVKSDVDLLVSKVALIKKLQAKAVNATTIEQERGALPNLCLYIRRWTLSEISLSRLTLSYGSRACTSQLEYLPLCFFILYAK